MTSHFLLFALPSEDHVATMKAPTTAGAFLALLHASKGSRDLNEPYQWIAGGGGDDSSLSSCVHHFGFEDASVLVNGQSFQSPNNDALFLTQSDDGKLIVREENTILWQSETSVRSDDGAYWTELMEGKGVVATYKGDPYDRSELTWTSASSSRNGVMGMKPFWIWKSDGRTRRGEHFVPVWTPSETDGEQGSQTKYFFGIDCEHQYVAVFEGTPNEPGDWVWRDRVSTEAFLAYASPQPPPPTASPTESPQAPPTITPTLTPPAPTASPSVSPSSMPPISKQSSDPFSFYVMGDGT